MAEKSLLFAVNKPFFAALGVAERTPMATLVARTTIVAKEGDPKRLCEKVIEHYRRKRASFTA
jgi:hypothetical protein